jgi:hypothetical protein
LSSATGATSTLEGALRLKSNRQLAQTELIFLPPEVRQKIRLLLCV